MRFPQCTANGILSLTGEKVMISFTVETNGENLNFEFPVIQLYSPILLILESKISSMEEKIREDKYTRLENV